MADEHPRRRRTTSDDHVVLAMDLEEVQSFVIVAEELHFGRAAERLHLDQSSLSRRVSHLERSFNVPLLDRSSRRVRLTTSGAYLLLNAPLLLEDAVELIEAVRRAAPQ